MFTLDPSGKYVDLFALYGIQNLGGNVNVMLVFRKQLTVHRRSMKVIKERFLAFRKNSFAVNSAIQANFEPR